MRDLSIYIEQGLSTNHKVAIGFHIINGVFDETADITGISYCLDCHLYEKLCQKIVDSGYGDLRAITNYGYSSFVVVCHTDLLLDNLKRMRSILLEDNLTEYYPTEIDLTEQRKAKNYRLPIDLYYYSARSSELRLAQPLRGHTNITFDLDMLNQWKSLHYNCQQCNVVLTGNTPEIMHEYATKTISNNLLEATSRNIHIPKHIPWRYSQLIISSSYKFTPDNILCAEAACKWLEPHMARGLNASGCRFSSIRIYPDYIQEWCVHAQCKRGCETMAIRAVMDALNHKPKTESNLNAVRKNTRNGYFQIAENIVEWNLFAGYNLFSGCRYHLPELLLDETYQQKINISSLHAILCEWQDRQNISIFATAAR